MHQCDRQCIYYRIKQDEEKTKLTCDMYEGEEINRISKHIKNNCNYYKTHKDIKLKYEVKFSLRNVLTKE